MDDDLMAVLSKRIVIQLLQHIAPIEHILNYGKAATEIDLCIRVAFERSPAGRVSIEVTSQTELPGEPGDRIHVEVHAGKEPGSQVLGLLPD